MLAGQLVHFARVLEEKRLFLFVGSGSITLWRWPVWNRILVVSFVNTCQILIVIFPFNLTFDFDFSALMESNVKC